MKRGTPEHPKVYDLCEKLKIRRPMALGYLDLLWDFASKYAPQGDVGRYSDKRIEAALDWTGASGRLVLALISAGWLDQDDTYRLIVHDWHDHCEESVRKKLLRANKQFLSVRQKVSGQNPVSDRTMSASKADNVCLARARMPLPLPLPKPEPIPVPDAVLPFEQAIEEIYKAHPRPGKLGDATWHLRKVLENAVDPAKVLESILQSHKAWCAHWKADPAGMKFVPGIAKWFEDKWYLKDPEAQAREPPKSKLQDLYERTLASIDAEEERGCR